MPEREAYVMKRQGCLRIQDQNTARLQEELVPRTGSPTGIPSALSVYRCLSLQSFYSSLSPTSFLCFSVGGRWLPITPQLCSQVPVIGKPVFPSQFYIPQDSRVASIRCLSLKQSAVARERGHVEQACLPLLTPEGKVGR